MGEYGLIVTMLSFTVNFLLLLGTNRLCGAPPGGLRAALASAVGAGQVVLCMRPGFSFLGSWLWRGGFLALMAIIAFGMKKSALKRGAVFALLLMALHGIAVGDGFWTVILAALVVFLLCMAGRAGPGRQYVPVTIAYGTERVSLVALVDTGNTLRDPVSGRPVLVADADAAKRLAGLSTAELACPVETVASGNRMGLRLIPYSAVGQPKGLLLGIQPRQVCVDGAERDCVVAFAPQRIGNGFQALAGGV